MHKSEPLIRTKLHLPFTRLELVTRQRLLEQMAQGLRGPLTLITAPAGFGKTTLAVSAVTGCGMPVAWLSLDKNDNLAGRFLGYLAAALQGANPGIGEEAAQMLAASPQAPFEVVLTSIINDLDTSGLEMILVLDDYQFINSTTVHESLTFLLEYCPTNLHLLIASRSDPALPLVRWRARGQAVELRAADLRFTEDEAARFLNEVMGLRLDAGSVVSLEERTEGWIAGLQMAALSLRDRQDVPGFIESFSGTNRHILDYLLEEVLASEPEEVQGFLLQTSILNRLTGSLCDVLTGSSVGQEMLERLESRNLFVVPLDNDRHWYRYHHLFADLLRARLRQAHPDLIYRLHIQASGWLEQHNYLTDAIHHLYAAGEYGRASDLIEHYGPACLAQGDPSVFQLAENLPKEILVARPKIGLYLAWLLIIHSQIEKAIPLLNSISQHVANPETGTGMRWMQTIVATALAFLSLPDSLSEFTPLPEYELLDQIPPDELLLRNAADFLYGMALGRRGETDRAIEISLKCIQREKQSHGSLAIPTLAPFLSRVYLMQGRLHDCFSLCREYLDPIQEKGIRFLFSAGSMKIDLGEVLYEWNCLEEAEQYIRGGIQNNELWQNIMTDGFGLIALTRLLQAKGDFEEAMQIVEKFESRMHCHSRTPREFDEDLRTLRVRTRLASGDLQYAVQWADQVQLSEDFGLHKVKLMLTLARIRLVQGRYEEVVKILSGTAPTMTEGSWITRQIESCLLQAAAIAGQKRLPEALGFIDSCLALAEQEGYIRVFINFGEPARDLLSAYIRSGDPAHKLYAQKVLNVFPLESQESIQGLQQAGVMDPLTGRELEVLHLMALGCTNQEVARQLIVSPGTVKAHTASIYRKLDVANRTEAVTRARQLGILP